MSDNIFDCQYFERCENNHKCYLCDDFRLLSFPKDKWNKKYKKRSNNPETGWKGLEQQVADMLNAVPPAKKAYNDLENNNVFGLLDIHKKGIKEVYENSSEVRGKNSTTIYKKDLVSIIKDKIGAGFKFKDSNKTYIIIDYDNVSDLVVHLKFLIDENIRFKEQLSAEEYEESIFPKLGESHRQLRSGGIWTMPGDVRDHIMLVEAKQRTLTNSVGELKFVIKRKVLRKIENEANFKQIPALVFRMSDDDTIYGVLKYENLMELISQLKFAYKENKLLQMEVLD